MKKPTFIWLVSLLLAGFVLAVNEEKIDIYSTEAKTQQDEMVIGSAQQQDSNTVAAKLGSEQGEELPIKIKFDSSNPLPVELKLKHNSDVIPKVEVKSDGGFRIEVKESLITKGISVAAVIIAAIAAGFAWLSASNTKVAAQGSLFFELTHRYDSDDMSNALRKVWDWDKTVGEDKSKRPEKAKEWIDNKATKAPSALELNQSRRKVTHYYLNVLELRRLKCLKKKFIEHMFKQIGAEILDVLEPLEIENINNHQAKTIIQKKSAIKELKRNFDEIRRIVNDKAPN